MSDSERSSGSARAAAEELGTLVSRLGEEMASFRRRAQTAEARVRELEDELSRARREAAEAAAAVPDPDWSKASDALAAPAAVQSNGADGERVAALQQENEELRARLEGATSRTRQMLERLRFLRQQHTLGGPR